MTNLDPLNSSKQIFLKTCSNNNFDISESKQHLLENYVSLLLSYNKKINLISRVDEENIWTNHILHCTSLLFHKAFPPSSTILDLGTGGGLPGIVYAILHPGLQFTLLDATRKKTDAVQAMVEQLELTNVHTVRGRAEEIGKDPDYAGKFNIIVARAVAPLDKLVQWSKPFLCSDIPPVNENATSVIPDRSLVAFKGGDISDELKKTKQKSAVLAIDFIVLDPDEEKKVVIIQL